MAKKRGMTPKMLTLTITALLLAASGCAQATPKSDPPDTPVAPAAVSDNDAEDQVPVTDPVKAIAFSISAPELVVDGQAISKSIDNFTFGDGPEHLVFEHISGQTFTVYETRLTAGKWSEPVSPSYIQPDVSEGRAVFSADGNRVVFHSFRSDPSSDTLQQRLDLWTAERGGPSEAWSDPKPLEVPRSAASDFYYYPTLASDGTLYFTSFRSDSLGKDDIYRSKLVDGVYQAPENLGTAVNSAEVDGYPSISPDGNLLVFSRLTDLYLSIQTNGEWSPAEPVGVASAGIASPRSPMLSPDRSELLFIGEKDGVASIYKVKLTLQ